MGKKKDKLSTKKYVQPGGQTPNAPKEQEEILNKSKTIKKQVPAPFKEEPDSSQEQIMSLQRDISDSDSDESRQYPTRAKVPNLPAIEEKKLVSDSDSEPQEGQNNSMLSESRQDNGSQLDDGKSQVSRQSRPSRVRKDRKRRKRIKNAFEEYLEVEAEESEGDQQERDQEAAARRRKNVQDFFQKRYGIQEDKPLQAYLRKLHHMKDAQIKLMYEQKAEEMEAERSQQRTQTNVFNDTYLYSNLYELSCRKNQDMEDIMIKMLNKAEYCRQNPKSKYVWKVFSVLYDKKLYPGKIFLEAENEDDIIDSVESFYGINTKSLQKIQYEGFTALFSEKNKKDDRFKPGDYVVINKGVYSGDLARVFKVNKQNLTVEIIPRINFPELNKKIQYLQQKLGEHISEAQLNQNKSKLFELFLKPIQNHMKGIPVGKQKPILASDLEPYKNLQACNRIQLTEKGLFLLKFGFNEVRMPSTEIIEEKLFLQDEEEQPDRMRGKMALDVQNGDRVQVVQGELQGLGGIIVNVGVNSVRIKCSSGELKNVVFDEISAYVQKFFTVGEQVFVVAGQFKGEKGTVLENNTLSVKVKLTNGEKPKIPKRNVFSLAAMDQMSQKNQYFEVDDIVELSTSNQFAIVVQTYKNYVDYITYRNELNRALNIDLIKKKSKNDKRGMKVLHGDYLTRDCIAQIEIGPKINSTMLVKQVYNNYAFMLDEERVKLGFGNYGIWVERASHCRSLSTIMPKINPHSLKDQLSKVITGKKDYSVKPINQEDWLREQIAIGKQYILKDTSYIGRKGKIIKVTSKYFEVKVNNAILKLEIQKEKNRRKSKDSRNDREDSMGGTPANYSNYRGSPLSAVSVATPVRRPANGPQQSPAMSEVSIASRYRGRQQEDEDRKSPSQFRNNQQFEF